MKAYIISIIGATLLAAMAGILAPEKWRSYVRIITGLVIISCIVSPVTAIIKTDIFDGFDSVGESIEEGESIQRSLVTEELERRINEDIEARMKKEFSLDVSAECAIKVNDEGEIEGVESIYIYGDGLTERERERLCEVYGLSADEVHDE